MKTTSVLFVCLGNICRSPTAHGLMRAKLVAADWLDWVTLDSAGTGDWHLGHAPDGRARRAAKARGIEIGDLRARQIRGDDFAAFDRVLAMDGRNYADLRALAARADPERVGRIELFSAYCSRPLSADVPDPYAGGADGFERVLDMIDDGTETLFHVLREEISSARSR